MIISRLCSCSLLPLLGIVLTGFAMAADIATDMQSGESRLDGERGGFLELGVTADVQRRALAKLDADENGDAELEIGLSLSAGYRYKRLFFEATQSGFDGINFGVNLLENEQWSLDLLLANVAGNITYETDKPPPPETEAQRNEAILERDSLFAAAGMRLTRYIGDNILQLRLVSDWHDNNGIQASARVGRQWQLGNWNLRGVVGGRYYSSQFNDYLFGVDSAEASERFPVYQATNAFIPEVELGASVPITEDWVFSSRLRARQYPDSVTDSPLVVNNKDVIFSTGIHYVF